MDLTQIHGRRWFSNINQNISKKNVLYLKNMYDNACSEISSNTIYYNQTMMHFLVLPDKSLENNTS